MPFIYSFWGKFGQRSNLKQNKYVYSQADFVTYLLDQRKVIDDFHILNEDTCMISYDVKTEFVEDCPTSNVVVASFTTCWARLKLYGVLQQVGERCLYFDTDSVIFSEKKDEPNPIKLGDYLGDLTDELKNGNHITSFVAGGPKNYAYVENTGAQTCKVRGFTLNYENSALINFETVKNLVQQNSREKIMLPSRNRITRDKHVQKVVNRMEDRKYGLVYTKRRIVGEYNTLPYGYVD